MWAAYAIRRGRRSARVRGSSPPALAAIATATGISATASQTERDLTAWDRVHTSERHAPVRCLHKRPPRSDTCQTAHRIRTIKQESAQRDDSPQDDGCQTCSVKRRVSRTASTTAAASSVCKFDHKHATRDQNRQVASSQSEMGTNRVIDRQLQRQQLRPVNHPRQINAGSPVETKLSVRTCQAKKTGDWGITDRVLHALAAKRLV